MKWSDFAKGKRVSVVLGSGLSSITWGGNWLYPWRPRAAGYRELVVKVKFGDSEFLIEFAYYTRSTDAGYSHDAEVTGESSRRVGGSGDVRMKYPVGHGGGEVGRNWYGRIKRNWAYSKTTWTSAESATRRR